MSIHCVSPGVLAATIDGFWLTSHGMALLTIAIGVGAFGLSRVFKPRRQPFPVVAAPPRHALIQNDDGQPRVRGRASSETLVTSPFTHTPCCYYYAEIEQDLPVLGSSPDSSSGGTWNWSNIHISVSTIAFLLEDPKGGVRISPAVLQVQDVPVTFEYQVPESDRSEQDQALVDYVTKNCPDKLKTGFANLVQTAFLSEERAADPLVQQRLQEWRKRRERVFQRRTKEQRFRFRERCILPGGEYAIAGVAVAGTSGSGERVLSTNRDK